MPGSRYQQWTSKLVAPSWLQGPWGTRWMATMGNLSDIVVDAAEQAVGVRYINACPLDALPYHGQDRMMPRYPADIDAGYRARLAAAWTTWQTAGTLPCLQTQLLAFGFLSVGIYVATGAAPPGVGVWPPDSDTTNWSRFWVVLPEPFPAFLGWSLTAWGDNDPRTPGIKRKWGALGVDGTPYTWGSTATAGQVASIRALIRQWKPVHAVCAGIWPTYTAAGVTLYWNGS